MNTNKRKNLLIDILVSFGVMDLTGQGGLYIDIPLSLDGFVVWEVQRVVFCRDSSQLFLFS